MKRILLACMLAMLLTPGSIHGQSFQKALKLAEQGDSWAAWEVGYAYREGQGVPKDLKESLKWYLRAAHLGDRAAQFNLALLYKQGDSDTPRDLVVSYMWAKLSEKAGNDHAGTFRKDLEKEMTSGQIQKAQRLAEQWKKKSWDEVKAQFPD